MLYVLGAAAWKHVCVTTVCQLHTVVVVVLVNFFSSVCTLGCAQLTEMWQDAMHSSSINQVLCPFAAVSAQNLWLQCNSGVEMALKSWRDDIVYSRFAMKRKRKHFDFPNQTDENFISSSVTFNVFFSFSDVEPLMESVISFKHYIQITKVLQQNRNILLKLFKMSWNSLDRNIDVIRNASLCKH